MWWQVACWQATKNGLCYFGRRRTVRDRRHWVFESKVFLMICWSWILPHNLLGRRMQGFNFVQKTRTREFGVSFSLDMVQSFWYFNFLCLRLPLLNIFSLSSSFALHLFNLNPLQLLKYDWFLIASHKSMKLSLIIPVYTDYFLL